jgi:hypothetical protein
MRKERHALANEAQRGYAFELKLTKLEAAHAELTARAARLEAELVRERAARADCEVKLEALRERTAGPAPAGVGGSLRDPEFRLALETLRKQLDRVLGPGAAPAEAQSRSKPAAPACIDIEFEA